MPNTQTSQSSGYSDGTFIFFAQKKKKITLNVLSSLWTGFFTSDCFFFLFSFLLKNFFFCLIHLLFFFFFYKVVFNNGTSTLGNTLIFENNFTQAEKKRKEMKGIPFLSSSFVQFCLFHSISQVFDNFYFILLFFLFVVVSHQHWSQHPPSIVTTTIICVDIITWNYYHSRSHLSQPVKSFLYFFFFFVLFYFFFF